MFPSKEAMSISTTVGQHFYELLHNLSRIQGQSLAASAGEVQYFRSLFHAIKNYLNNVRFVGIRFDCNVKELHKKPIVRYHPNKRCELGDYLVNVKYLNGNNLLGKKIVIYQFKMNEPSKGKGASRGVPRQIKWKIDQKQLTLLSSWPTFYFGMLGGRRNAFSLSPSTPELGSYWLAERYTKTYSWPAILYHYDLISPALTIKAEQESSSIKIRPLLRSYDNLWYSGACALSLQLIWRYGEIVVLNTQTEKFLNALYRFCRCDPDPPEEFKAYSTKHSDEKPFWIIEIRVIGENSN